MHFIPKSTIIDSIGCVSTASTKEQCRVSVTDQLPHHRSSICRIVVVVGHTLFREGVESLLNSKKGMWVLSSTNCASTGLESCQQLKPDVAIVDMALPGLSCFETLFRASSTGSSQRFLFLAEQTSDLLLEWAICQGVHGLLAREDGVDTLLQAIDTVVRGKSFISSYLRGRFYSKGSHLDGSLHSRKGLLSPREVDVLRCVARGMKAKAVGESLMIAPKTVERHKANIMQKLQLKSQVDLAVYAVREGFII